MPAHDTQNWIIGTTVASTPMLEHNTLANLQDKKALSVATRLGTLRTVLTSKYNSHHSRDLQDHATSK